MKLLRGHLWILVLIIVVLLVFVSRETQKRHIFVEKMEEDRILDEKDKEQIRFYLWDTVQGKATDATKLSNKAKVFFNTVTENPLTAITDSAMAKYTAAVKRYNIPEGPQPLNKSMLIDLSIIMSLPIIFDYQEIYKKSESVPSRADFETDLQEILSKSFFVWEVTVAQAIVDNKGKTVTSEERGPEAWMLKTFAPLNEFIIDLCGSKLITKKTDGTHRFNLNGPLQRNLVDLTYNYFYPTPDLFTWLKNLILG